MAHGPAPEGRLEAQGAAGEAICKGFWEELPWDLKRAVPHSRSLGSSPSQVMAAGTKAGRAKMEGLRANRPRAWPPGPRPVQEPVYP